MNDGYFMFYMLLTVFSGLVMGGDLGLDSVFVVWVGMMQSIWLAKSAEDHDLPLMRPAVWWNMGAQCVGAPLLNALFSFYTF